MLSVRHLSFFVGVVRVGDRADEVIGISLMFPKSALNDP